MLTFILPLLYSALVTSYHFSVVNKTDVNDLYCIPVQCRNLSRLCMQAVAFRAQSRGFPYRIFPMDELHITGLDYRVGLCYTRHGYTNLGWQVNGVYFLSLTFERCAETYFVPG